MKDKEAGVTVCAFDGREECNDVSITGNIVAGAIDMGFAAPGNDCGDYEKEVFKNNVAHSINGVGAAIYPKPSQEKIGRAHV